MQKICLLVVEPFFTLLKQFIQLNLEYAHVDEQLLACVFILFIFCTCYICVCICSYLAGVWAHWRTCSSYWRTGGWSDVTRAGRIVDAPSPSPPPQPPCGAAPPPRWPIASLLCEVKGDRTTNDQWPWNLHINFGNIKNHHKTLNPPEANNTFILSSDVFQTSSCLTFFAWL